MLRYAVAAMAALSATTASAAALSPTDIVNRHIAAAAKLDVDAIMADYADDAVVLQAGQAVQGKAAIRAMFERIFPRPAAGSAPPAGAPQMQVKKVWQEGNVGLANWTMGPVNGSDSFLVRDGKIVVQAVFMAPPPAPPAPAQ
jgi:SnoaL-like protein